MGRTQLGDFICLFISLYVQYRREENRGREGGKEERNRETQNSKTNEQTETTLMRVSNVRRF